MSSPSASKPASGVDSQENRAYIQKQRLWTLGETLSMALMTQKPADPIAKIIETLEAEMEKRTEQVDAPSIEVVNDAKQYMQELRIAFLFEDWLKNVLEAKPEKAVEFSLEFFKKIQGGNKGSAAASSAATVVIGFDSSAPNTAFAAKAASVGVVELGNTAVVKAINDIAAQELVGASAIILVVGDSDANDAGIVAKLGPATSQLPGAVVVTGAEVSDERAGELTRIFGRIVPTDKPAAAASSTGAAVAASRGRVLLILQQDDGAAAAANLLGRNIVDQIK